MKNILIVLAGIVDEDIQKIINDCDINYIVAVDGGYIYLEKYNINPDLYIGDMDSVKNEVTARKIIKLNVKKDYTDYQSALEYIKENIEHINKTFVVGYISSKRLEHFYSNLMLIKEKMYYLSDNTCIYMLSSGNHIFSCENEFISKYKYISFFAYEKVENLSLINFKYELDNYTLTPHDNLCISNEISKNKQGEVKFTNGKLLVFLSKEDN